MPSLGGALGGAASGAMGGIGGGPLGIAVGAGIGGLVGAFTGGKSKLQKQLENKIDPSLNNLMHWSGQSRDKQNQLFGLSFPSLEAATNYFTGILDPNNATALNAALGPQRTALNDQYQGALNQIGSFAPRGGGRNQMLGDAVFQRNRNMMELVPKARAEAAAGALQAGSITGNQALNWGNLSTEQAAAVLQAVQGILSGQMSEKARKDQGAAGITSQLGYILAGILPQLKGKLGGGGAGSASDPRAGAGSIWPE